jgi:hypothetical protein
LVGQYRQATWVHDDTSKLNGCGSHLPTLIRAALAGLGATLAVFHFVLPAFRAARLAHLGAQVADFVDEP